MIALVWDSRQVIVQGQQARMPELAQTDRWTHLIGGQGIKVQLPLLKHRRSAKHGAKRCPGPPVTLTCSRAPTRRTHLGTA